MNRLIVTTAFSAALLPTLAHAETQELEYNPELARTEVLSIFTVNSPTVNAGAFTIHAEVAGSQEVELTMDGHAIYDWEDEAIRVEGTNLQGEFTNIFAGTVTLVIVPVGGTEVRFELQRFEESAAGTFTPYVLPGSETRPFTIIEDILPEQTLTNPGATLPGIGWPVEVHYGFNVSEISWSSNDITVNTAREEAGTLLSTIEGEIGAYDLELGELMENQSVTEYATLHGEISSNVELFIPVTIDPPVVAPITVPLSIAWPSVVALPLSISDCRTDAGVAAPGCPLTFTKPREPVQAGTSGDDNGDAGGSTTAAPGDDNGDDATTSGEAPGTTGQTPRDDSGGSSGGPIPGFDSGSSSSGCGCNTPAPAPAGVFGLLSLFGLRRRRRTA